MLSNADLGLTNQLIHSRQMRLHVSVPTIIATKPSHGVLRCHCRKLKPLFTYPLQQLAGFVNGLIRSLRVDVLTETGVAHRSTRTSSSIP
jgi:hypothetical protein